MFVLIFQTEDCAILSSSKGICKVPEATTALKRDLANKLSGTVKLHLPDVCSDCIRTEARVQLDGVSQDFILTYYRDPVLHNLSKQQIEIATEAKDNRLNITVSGINLILRGWCM